MTEPNDPTRELDHDIKAVDGKLGAGLGEDDRHIRATCDQQGYIGHYGCGMCDHGLVYFQCQPCMTDRVMRAERAAQSSR